MDKRMTERTKALMFQALRTHRSLDVADLIRTDTVGQGQLVFRFLEWCKRTNTRFGEANFDEVFARFQRENRA